jgi:hypothetical protein
MHELEGIAARLDDGAAVIAAPQAGPLCPVVWRWLLDARTRGLVEAANQSPTETTAWRLSEAGTKRASELLSSSWERLKERITTADSMARRIMDSPLLRLLWGAVPVGAILIYLETPPVRTVVLSLYVLLGVVAAWLYIDHLRYIRRRKGRGRLAPATQKAPRRSHAVRLAVVKECATQLVVKQDAELSALRPRFTAAGGRQ